MQLIRELPEFADAPTAVAIGNFDGMHRGHRAVIDTMLLAAMAHSLIPSVLTFEPHPRKLFAPHAPAFRLEPLALKLRRLRDAGVARVYMPRFTRSFANVSAERFMNEVLKKSLGAKTVVTGEGFVFGKDRTGDNAALHAWGVQHAVDVVAVKPVTEAGQLCSSSAIRHALGVGDMAQVATLFGRPYQIAGRVMHGAGRGAGLGFATANISLSPRGKWPSHGVYAVRAHVNGHRYDGVANLGVRPTVESSATPNLEVHLFDTQAVLYGQRMTVDFYGKIRDEQKFDSLAALTAQIAEDCARAKERLQGQA